MPSTQDEVASAGRWTVPACALAAYAILCAGLIIASHRATGGPVLSPLDDTYIHMALAQSISHGFYGINPGHPSSPSSSVLWPFLLAPFARLHAFFYIPLAFNLLFGAAAALFLGFFVSARAAAISLPRKLLTAIALLFVSNLPALTMLAMEHVLQCLLAAICAYGIVRALRGESIPTWAIAAAILAPSVRYECFALTLAMAAALWAQRRIRALSALALAFVGPGALGIFLHHKGLPFLPMSVLNKGGASFSHTSLRAALLLRLHEIGTAFLAGPAIWVLVILCLVLTVAAWQADNPVRRRVLAGSAAACLLHVAIGRIGFWNRYEPYILLFGALIVLDLAWQAPQNSLGTYALTLYALCVPYLVPTYWLPSGSHGTFVQQYQTARLLHSMPETNVAVNDLGLVALNHPPSQYVLDLAGLGSTEFYTVPGGPAWLDTITRLDHIGVVAIYPTWFGTVPSGWTELGHYCPPVVSCVVVYATGLTPVEPLRAQFREFARTAPPDAGITVAREATR